METITRINDALFSPRYGRLVLSRRWHTGLGDVCRLVTLATGLLTIGFAAGYALTRFFASI
jgi:hypothetical protein